MNNIFYRNSCDRVDIKHVTKTLEDFPVFYQLKKITLKDPLLQEYLLLSIDEIWKKLSEFRNKIPCGNAHERNVLWTPIVYPDWISEEEFTQAFHDIILWKENPIFYQVSQFSQEQWMNAVSCKHKINNLNCYHPEKTWLAQLSIILLSFFRQKNLSFDFHKSIALINQLTDIDLQFSKNYQLLELQGIKNLQFDIWGKVWKLIESIQSDLNIEIT